MDRNCEKVDENRNRRIRGHKQCKGRAEAEYHCQAKVGKGAGGRYQRRTESPVHGARPHWYSAPGETDDREHDQAREYAECE